VKGLQVERGWLGPEGSPTAQGLDLLGCHHHLVQDLLEPAG